MWEKQIAKSLSARPNELPADYFEKMALDAGTVSAFAQLCGVDTSELGRVLPTFVQDRKAPDPDIVVGAYKFHHNRLIGENLKTAFPPGECWQRRQDFDAFVVAVKAGDEPDYQGFEVWR